MAPWILTAYNDCGKRIHIYTTADGGGYSLANEEKKKIEDYITADVYSKINIQDPDHFKGYKLKYNNYRIALNDNIGKSNGVADSEVHTREDTISIHIQVHSNDIKIYCRNDDLGISQSDGSIKYYNSVTATLKEGGGVTLKGFEPRGEDEVQEGDMQEASAKKETD